MAGPIGADLLVAGLIERTALVADGRGRYAGKVRKGRLVSPETASSEGGFFLLHGLQMRGGGLEWQFFAGIGLAA